MSYKISKKSNSNTTHHAGINFKNGTNSVNNILNEKFFEVELGEVLDVIYNQDKDSGDNAAVDDALDVYKVQVRLLLSQRNKLKKDCVYVSPIDANIKRLPLKGELVLVYEIHGNYYYGQTFSRTNSINLNPAPNISLSENISKVSIDADNYDEVEAGGPVNKNLEDFKYGNFFELDTKINPLKHYEGDLTIEGRFGNSIRFGSDITKGEQNSPNIILRAGQLIDAEKNGNSQKVKALEKKYLLPVDEDINDDGSSVWITTNQKLDLKEATRDGDSHFTSYPTIEKYDGKQIVLNSDRIMFNSKENEIIGFAKKGISFMTDGLFAIDNTKKLILNTEDKINLKAKSDIISKTETKFEVDSPKINLGAGAVEPVVLGNQLKKCLELICDAIQNGTYTGGGGVHSYTTIPLVSAVKSQIANILSGVSKTK